MISISEGRDYTGWQEAFIRTCIAMAREGVRSRKLQPRGHIEAHLGVHCPDCGADSYFSGVDLECGRLYETATANFCANCERFEIVTDEANFAPYSPTRFLQVFRFKLAFSSQEIPPSDSSSFCPVCGANTYTFHKDLGGIDYYDNYWSVCSNLFCDWPGAHREEFEWGPYTPSTGARVWVSDIRRLQAVFISYSTHDGEFAQKIFERLQKRGVSCWYAPHHMRGGKTLREQIRSAVRGNERLLLVLSEASMKSTWVQYELSEARKREQQEGRRVLFPIALVPFETLRNWVVEDDESPDLAREVRKYYIPDFSAWRDNSRFEVEFEKLVDALVPGAASAS